MDAAERQQPNWSAVAQGAFGPELCSACVPERERRKDGECRRGDSEPRPERRRLRTRSLVTALAIEWAIHHAEYHQLAAIDALKLSNAQTWAGEIVKIIAGDDNPSQRD